MTNKGNARNDKNNGSKKAKKSKEDSFQKIEITESESDNDNNTKVTSFGEFSRSEENTPTKKRWRASTPNEIDTNEKVDFKDSEANESKERNKESEVICLSSRNSPVIESPVDPNDKLFIDHNTLMKQLKELTSKNPKKSKNSKKEKIDKSKSPTKSPVMRGDDSMWSIGSLNDSEITLKCQNQKKRDKIET